MQRGFTDFRLQRLWNPIKKRKRASNFLTQCRGRGAAVSSHVPTKARVVGGVLLLLLLLAVITGMNKSASSLDQSNFLSESAGTLARSSFPSEFLFGTASSAYQFEGGAREGGRGPSIWDTFTHRHPDLIADRSNGDVAVDSYHRYKEDIRIMKGMSLNAYRFSISWTRILPTGSLSGGINKEGVQYYNNLINELLSNGLQPFVTLFHWDSPQGLEDNYGGFLSPRIVEDFRDYAEICFKKFGDRVKHWITLNEPWTFSMTGYPKSTLSAGKCFPWASGNCRDVNLGHEPYILSHHQILAHAAVVALYRDKFQAKQKGKIGIAVNSHWFVPYTSSKSDADAAQRAVDFMYGWIMDPLTQGDYPSNMRSLVGNRLPKFTDDQSKLIKGSFDFIGMNYYTTHYAYNTHLCSINPHPNYWTDSCATLTGLRNGAPIGPKTALDWLFIYPPGLRELLLYTKSKYNSPVIYITENGVDELNNKTASLQEALQDDFRIDYYRDHLSHIHEAIREGVDVRGFFAWSLLDNFEWESGYTVRFGLHFVDYKDSLKRYPKKSASWFREFLHN